VNIHLHSVPTIQMHVASKYRNIPRRSVHIHADDRKTRRAECGTAKIYTQRMFLRTRLQLEVSEPGIQHHFRSAARTLLLQQRKSHRRVRRKTNNPAILQLDFRPAIIAGNNLRPLE
jgi:hypothetical protein